MKKDVTAALLDFIDGSPSVYHTIANAEAMLEGFEELHEGQPWTIKKGGSYYVKRGDASLIAWRVPKNDYTAIRIVASHSDIPGFKLKADPEMSVDEHYVRLNTEKYGGMLMYTWFDRPLSIAGRIVTIEQGRPVTKLVNIDRDLLMIPSVAIHMNRKINENFAPDAHIDTIPLFSGEKKDGTLQKLVATAAGVQKDDILGSDLFVYCREKGRRWGAHDEFISACGLDDRQCVYATLQGFLEAKKPSEMLSMCCIFHNEEVGSLTGQGADSTMLTDTLTRINESLGVTSAQYLAAVANGFMISADNAHAVHPNHPEYADQTNRPYLNGGIVLKYNAAEKYTTNGESEAMFRDVCKRAGVPLQTFANR
ncbi:MAG: M18 family aminopeptidase, partial [Lachnospiraceae bacterium]|nr:M18 family aminopeptidase [Lachnospiraceae bacterium]